MRARAVMRLVVLRLAVLLPFVASAQEGCGELQALVQKLQQENAELIQQAAGHEQAKLEALKALEGVKQQASALEQARVQAEQQAAGHEAAKLEALQAAEQLKAQAGGHEAAKLEALQTVEGLKQQVAGHVEAKESAQREVEELKQQAALADALAKNLSATCNAGEETPYLSTDIFYKVFNILADVTSEGFDSIKETYPDWDKEITAVAWQVTNATMEQVQTFSVQASSLSVTLTQQALEAADKAKLAATDLHKTHLEPHLGGLEPHIAEAKKQGMELYTSHVEPHLGTAQKMYAESMHPHVERARTVLLSTLANVKEQTTAAYLMAKEAAKGGVTDVVSVWAASSQHLKTVQDMELLSPKVVKFGNRVLRFPRGVLDISAAMVQLTLVAFVSFIVLWRLCLKTLLWRLGVKVFGIRALNIVSFFLRICRFVMSLLVRVTTYVVMWALGLATYFTSLTLLSAVGCSLVYGVELSLLLGLGVGKGLSLPARAGAGLAIGLLCGMVLGCGTLTCGVCGKRKAKVAKDKKNGVAKAKPDAKAAAANGTNGKAPAKKK